MTAPNKTPPDDEAIKKLLADLRSYENYRRKAAANALAQLKPNNAEVINALKDVAMNDPSEWVREAAGQALITLGHEAPPVNARVLPTPNVPTEPQRPFYLQPDFWLGFVGWWVVNGLWGGMLNSMPSGGGISLESLLCLIAPLPLNFIVLVVAAFKRRYVAGGILVAVAVNLAIYLALGMFTDVWCAIALPFFSIP